VAHFSQSIFDQGVVERGRNPDLTAARSSLVTKPEALEALGSSKLARRMPEFRFPPTRLYSIHPSMNGIRSEVASRRNTRDFQLTNYKFRERVARTVLGKSIRSQSSAMYYHTL
jgi:hypothetical protein